MLNQQGSRETRTFTCFFAHAQNHHCPAPHAQKAERNARAHLGARMEQSDGERVARFRSQQQLEPRVPLREPRGHRRKALKELRRGEVTVLAKQISTNQT